MLGKLDQGDRGRFSQEKGGEAYSGRCLGKSLTSDLK